MAGPNKKDQMHPDDMRNLIVFVVIAAALYLMYDSYVLQPQKKAFEEARKRQATQEQIKGKAQRPEIILNENVQPVERAQALSDNPRISIENGKITGSISLRGGRIDDVALDNYYETLEEEDKVVLFSPAGTDFPRYAEHGWTAQNLNIPVPNSQTLWSVDGNNRLSQERPVTLYWDNGNGLRFEKTFSVDKNYLITVEQKVQNNTGQPVTLYPYGLVAQRGIPPYYEGLWVAYEGPLGFIGDELREPSYSGLRKDKSEEFESTQGWTGFGDKYWLSALLPPQNSNKKFRYSYAGPEKPEKNQGHYQTDYTMAPVNIAPGETGQAQSNLYVGPKRVLLLKEYGTELGVRNFDLAVDFGWLWFLSKPFFYALHYIGEAIGNFGFAIIILTVMIRSAVFPLTNISYRSFAKLKKVSPQIMELREKHGDDKQQLQGELVKMYEREGVNPLAGCLPIMLQIPIFFALYKTLVVTIEMRHAPFIGWIQDLSAPDPTAIVNLFGLLPYDVPEIPVPLIGDMIEVLLSMGIWPCLMLLAMIVQKKLNPPPQDPIQRDMANFFPFIIAYVMSSFAAGLVIYWTFSAFLSVAQQIIIMSSMGVPIHLFGQTKEEKEMEKAIDKGPAVHPEYEMIEDDIEEALFDEHFEGDDKPEITPPKRKKKKKKK